ncbi:MAG TPA: hypothetical protein VE291_13675 [Terracidiphilus sp.]|jgi:hypothetical protein|nr:hypothetical protein [Terracidiphilus sp.]
MRAWLLAAVCLAATPILAEPDAALRVEYSDPALMPASWTLVLHPDGSAHFHAERGTAVPDAGPGSGQDDEPSMEPAVVDRDVRLSGEFAGRVFDTVRRRHNLRGVDCESHMKVAFQGWKTLTYSGPDGGGSCRFNYSKDKEIQMLGESFVAVASTIMEGARLELILLHDPLGLDHEMEFMQEAEHDGRLQELGAIRGILEKLREDPAVMVRVRRRAQLLLADATK